MTETAEMTPYDRVIDHFGGVSQLAKALGCSRQAVHKWNGQIPPARAFQIEVITRRKIKAKELM